jgi:hypothetical protein
VGLKSRSLIYDLKWKTHWTTLGDDMNVVEIIARLAPPPNLGPIIGPSVPNYIGNAVGDYKARFTHGGSAVVFSQAAMNQIFIQNAEAVLVAHLESLDARWGDKLIATAAMKSGIYLKERVFSVLQWRSA